MDLHLQGKRALITGSTARIGFATARELPRATACYYVLLHRVLLPAFVC